MNKLLILNNSMVEKSHYDKAFNEIKEYVFKNLEFVKYIIRYGNLKHPGISDLDIILIIKKEQNCNIDLSLLKFNHFLKKYYSNIVFHFPLIINEILIDNLNDLFPIFKFSCYDKYGNKVNYNLKSSDEQNKFNLLRIFQSKFPRNFYNYKIYIFKILQELKYTKLEIKINLFI